MYFRVVTSSPLLESLGTASTAHYLVADIACVRLKEDQLGYPFVTQHPHPSPASLLYVLAGQMVHDCGLLTTVPFTTVPFVRTVPLRVYPGGHRV